jgi:hypothetical protein
MPTLITQGTKFTFSVLPPKEDKGYWVQSLIAIENEYVNYRQTCECLSFDELQELIFSASRLLAGAYGKEYSMNFERSGLAVDLYPYTHNGLEVSRQLRRENDCVMAIRLLLRSNSGGFLGGVYSFLLHRKEIEKFVEVLQKEFDVAYGSMQREQGKYLFVGVSPLGFKGCNYWYFDPTKSVKANEYVWVRMGRHNTEQIVYVDSVKFFDDDTAPYDPAKVKQVLRKATKEEIAKL